MKSFLKFVLSLLPVFLVSTDLLATESELREVIVSHTDENNILQLYYVGGWLIDAANNQFYTWMPPTRSLSKWKENCIFTNERRGNEYLGFRHRW